MTLTEVIAEIKDQRTRQFLESTPYQLKVVQGSSIIDDKDMARVENFALDTGDKSTLSKVDMMVIAAGLSITRANGEVDKVRLKPAELSEFQPRFMKKDYEGQEEEDMMLAGEAEENVKDDFNEF